MKNKEWVDEVIAIHIHYSSFILLYFSIGTFTALPHSVHEPS